MSGLFRAEEPLEEILGRMGGGIEIRTAVNLPMGSGLGTSSILAAALLRALWEMRGVSLDDHRLSEQVMRLEQIMTTGGGWQDQAGGIFPGAKLLVSGPGLRQRIRVQPVPWTPQRAAEFESRLVVYYTGIRRIARDLLRQVVGRYLARETSAVQVLHSIKTLAMEMSYALQEGEWERLGALLDRHWELNQVLDPNTTNAPIHRLLERVRPYIHGAKLAGAGGGGFLIMLARSPEAASELRRFLQQQPGAEAGVHACCIAPKGLRYRTDPHRRQLASNRPTGFQAQGTGQIPKREGTPAVLSSWNSPKVAFSMTASFCWSIRSRASMAARMFRMFASWSRQRT